MKFSSAAALTGLLSSTALAAKSSRTFAVLHFEGKEIMTGSVDPIVDPGVKSKHVHSFMGATNFGLTVDATTLKDSKCSNVKVAGDMSIYWTPTLYFHDKAKGTFEKVPMYYQNVYYFFEKTDDDIKPFPLGLQLFAGNASLLQAPNNGVFNLNPDKGEVTPAVWTCPRSSYSPSSWPTNSDGTPVGPTRISDGEGLGLPLQKCDGLYSPLRADIHMPSCYNPKAALTDYKTNSAYPNSNGNCPDGWMHLPHIFYEVYWDTQSFSDRWTADGKTQPFVLSNGDVTGQSLHADFVAGWDEDVLSGFINTCNAAHAGVEACPGATLNPNAKGCTMANPLGDEVVDGVLDAIPGIASLKGYEYGEAANPPASDAPATTKTSTVSNPIETSVQVPDPTEDDNEDNYGEGNAENVSPTTTLGLTTTLACATTVKTIWETVTVTAEAYPQ